MPRIAACFEPAASITARMSSIRASRVGSPTSRSESPVPRLSKMISREKEAMRSMLAGEARLLPLVLEVGDEARRSDQVEAPRPRTW